MENAWENGQLSTIRENPFQILSWEASPHSARQPPAARRRTISGKRPQKILPKSSLLIDDAVSPRTQNVTTMQNQMHDKNDIKIGTDDIR